MANVPSAARLSALSLALLLAAPPADVSGQESVHFYFVRGGLAWADAIKAAAGEMNTAKAKMGFSYNTKFNSKYWKQTQGPARWALRAREGENESGPEVNPAEAVLDVLKNPDEYSLECATALKFVLYIAIIKNVGSGPFNTEVKKTPLEIGAKDYESILKKVMRRGLGRAVDEPGFPGMASGDCAPAKLCDHTAEERNDAAFVKNTLEPGDAVYIVNLKTDSTAWQGENTLYIAGEQAFGYPLGLKTISEIKNHVKAHWIRDAGKSQIGGVPNGPPGFVYDYFRADPNELKNLGNWVTK